MAYQVQTPVFEGPFDLLLHLINAEQVDLYEVPISRIVDGYLAEIERMESLDLEVATEFILIASTLIELKCRRLLPGPDEVELDEEMTLWEERDLLLARLLECKTFKDVSRALEALEDLAALSYPRAAGPDERFAGLVADLLAGVSAEDLHDVFVSVATPKPPSRIDLTHVIPEGVSVAEAVVGLMQELSESRRATFRQLTAHLGQRLQVIVRFLAVLELYKRGLVDLDQGSTFGELSVVWTGTGPADAAIAAVGAVAMGEYLGVGEHLG